MPKYLVYFLAIKTSLFQLLLMCSHEAVDTTVTHTGTHPSCTQLHPWLQLGAASTTTAAALLSAPPPHVRHRGEVSGAPRPGDSSTNLQECGATAGPQLGGGRVGARASRRRSRRDGALGEQRQREHRGLYSLAART